MPIFDRAPAPRSAGGPPDAGELFIKVLLANDPAGQALAVDIFRAIKQAHKTWQSAAMLTGVQVMSITAVGGTLIGPPLAPLIIAIRPGTNDFERKLVQAIATVVGNSWIAFCATVRAPGLPWYPSFAAVPSPVAPPMPNVPTPFNTLTHVPGLLAPGIMKPPIMAQLRNDKAAEGIVDSVLSAFQQFISAWTATTMVTNVLGTGPVPSFAPPFVPVGPVVGGTANMIPGGLL